jgi:hypothetical protein
MSETMPAVLEEREGTPGLPETWELFVQAMHSAPLVEVCCKRVMMWAISVGRPATQNGSIG